MIFPIFHGFPNLRALITWLLVAVNCVFYYSFEKNQVEFEENLMSLYDDKIYVQLQGQIFAQIIDQHPIESTPILNQLAVQAQKGDFNAQDTLGSLAFRSTYFQKYASMTKFVGDQIQYGYWIKKYKKIMEDQKLDPSFALGIRATNFSFITQITYQFVHGSLIHLLSNLWFLIIFGSFLERFWGSLSFLLFYIISGMVAAIVFVLMSGISEAPLIGASGSISGLMGLVLVLFWNKKINCFYWVLPKMGYSGFKKFPAWIVLIVWLISDLSGYLGTMDEFGGVAHAAHLGGFFFGAAIGLGVSLHTKFLKNSAYASS